MTAVEVLSRLEAEGIQLYLEDGKLKWRGPRGGYTDAHKALVKPVREEIISLLGGSPGGLQGGGEGTDGLEKTRETPPPPPWWPVELVEWAIALTLEDVPAPPFNLRPGVRVVGPRWLERLQEDLQRGPDGPRARTGAVAEDLTDLWALMHPAPELSGEIPDFRSDGDQSGQAGVSKIRAMSGKAAHKASSQAS